VEKKGPDPVDLSKLSGSELAKAQRKITEDSIKVGQSYVIAISNWYWKCFSSCKRYYVICMMYCVTYV
jgi:hypothetical protein